MKTAKSFFFFFEIQIDFGFVGVSAFVRRSHVIRPINILYSLLCKTQPPRSRGLLQTRALVVERTIVAGAQVQTH